PRKALMMDGKVDQDAIALRDYLAIRGLNDGEIGRALARMKEAGRQAGLREAAAKCLEVSGLIGAGHGSSIDSALREAANAITALSGEGKQ
ncbi:hypothetical protein K7W03_27365, partial [Sphingobium sp. PNB]|uniref:hypothetical protein n=1 Tax=Sphingobium sp. PNB TaxID=863934 RepID=UPI001CA3E8A9